MIARELLVKLGFNIDEKKLDKFSLTINSVKSRIYDLREQINEQLSPNIDISQLAAYKKELSNLTIQERKEVEELNKMEALEAKESAKRNRAKLRELQLVKSRLEEQKRTFRRVTNEAARANATVSRYFTRFALGIGGGFLLNLRSTLRSAEEQKTGKQRASAGGFTNNQIKNVDNFNRSLIQTRRITTSLRNTFISGLLPPLKELLDKMNYWLVTNKELVQSSLKSFVEGLSGAIGNIASAVFKVLKFLKPVTDKLGGLKTVFTVLIGGGILSWFVKFGINIYRIGKPVASVVAAFAEWTGITKVLRLALTILSRNPIILAITTIVTLLGLLVEEIYLTAKGGDTLINRFKPLRAVFDLATTAISGFAAGIEEALGWIGKLYKKIESFSLSKFKEIKDFFSDLPKIDLFSDGKLPEDLKNLEKIKVAGTDLNIYKADNIAPKFAENAQMQRKAGQNITRNNTINISVANDSGSSKELAGNIGDEVRKELERYERNSNAEMLNAIGVTN